jgi:hypothetical protein
LKRYIGLHSVNIHQLLGDVPYIGYEFGCNWEEEHGYGVMMHGMRQVAIGDADTALHLWVAQKDKGILMAIFFDHLAITWLGADPFSLPIYGECFAGATPTTYGESPYLNAKNAGISFALTRDHKVKTVFLYSEGLEGFSAYGGALPNGLSLASSRAEVRAAVGDPVMSGEKGGIGLMAIDFSFDRFEDGKNYMNFQYLPGDKGIHLLVIGSCDE